MSGHDKDDLSRFFRRASQKPEIKFDEGNWMKLEAMLDKESAKSASAGRLRKRTGLAVVAVLSLITIGALWYGISTGDIFSSDKTTIVKNSSTVKKSTNNISIAPENTDPNLSTRENNVDEKTATIFHKPIESTVSDSNERDAFNKIEKNKNTSDKKNKKVHAWEHVDVKMARNSSAIKTPVNNISKADKESDRHLSAGKNNLDGEGIDDKQAAPSDEKDISGKTEIENITSSEKYVREKVTGRTAEPEDKPINKQIVDQSSKTIPSTAVTINKGGITENQIPDDNEQMLSETALTTRTSSMSGDSSTTTLLNPDLLTSKKEEAIQKEDSISDNEKSKTKTARWSILFSFSPDFSSIGLTRITAPGEAIGITTHYHVTPAFTVYAGVIGSHKKYQNYGGDYKPTEDHYWSKHTNGIRPKEILGSCDMLEIPIGVQYTIAHMKKSTLYVSAMLSSYIMYNESYQYSFETPNPGAASGWNAKKSSTYLFNVVGFSAGYERRLSKHFALGISPYIKIPLSSIGSWADMKLYSIGAALTVRYSLLKKELPDPPILRRSSD